MEVFVNKRMDLELEKDFINKFIALLGVRGSGKSNSAAVLCENYLDNHVGISIIDIDGEYWGLKEKYEILIVGGSKADIPLNVENGKILAKLVLENNIPIIIDLSETLKEERNQFLLDYLSELWFLEQKMRKVHILIIEEAHEFIPQGIQSELKERIEVLAKRGRKRGIGAVIVSQRAAKVEKDILTQAEMFFLHKVTFPTDFGVYAELTGKSKTTIANDLKNFKPGDIFLKYSGNIEICSVREQNTFHAGFSPKLENNIQIPDLKQLSKDLIETFQVASKQVLEEKNQIEKLEAKLKKKDSEILEYEKKIADLELQLKIISKLQVELPSEQVIKRAVINELQAIGMNISDLPEAAQSIKIPEGLFSDFNEPFMKAVENIKQILYKASTLDINVLIVLQANYPDEMKIKDIAKRIRWTHGTLSSNPPKYLIKNHIISRKRGERAEYLYSSELKKFIEERMEIYSLTPDILNKILEYIISYISFLSTE
ncbi:MAG: ATP-binding protein [Promethearchaeota archaeon]